MSGEHTVLDEISAYITRRMEAWNTPALQVALFDREGTRFVKAYRYASLEARVEATDKTLFQIGSITKSFTALAVMRASEVGLVDLDAPITRYLPWFEVRSRFEPIKVRHLLTHTAGLVEVLDQSPDIRGAVYALRETEVGWAPGEKMHYSDMGYQLLTLLLEKVFEKSYSEVIRTEVFRPLMMAESHAGIVQEIRERMASGYTYLYDDRPPHRGMPLVPSTWIETASGDCCIVSTAEDMARFGRMLLNEGMGSHARLISEDGYEELTRQHADAGWCGYGYGIMVRERNGATYVGHSGGMPGFRSELIVDCEAGLGLVLLGSHRLPMGLQFDLFDMWRGCKKGELVLPVPQDPTLVENTGEYEGLYKLVVGEGGPDRFVLNANGGRLLLEAAGEEVGLETRGIGMFYIRHSLFERFLLKVERDKGRAWYGGCLYLKESYAETLVHLRVKRPKEWDGYVGHYRAHNPWQTNFRVVARLEELWLIWPEGEEDQLFAEEDVVFRIGGMGSPERVRFGDVVDGVTLRAELNGCEYYRFFTG